MKIKPIVLATSILMTPGVLAQSQWGNDPSNYIAINDIADAGQTVVDSKGNIISGFSKPDENYDFYLSKFDRNGNQLWNGEKVLVEDRDQSYIFTWSLELGQDDAIYTSIENQASNEVLISKNHADGTAAWQYSPNNENQFGAVIGDISPNDKGVAFSYNYSAGWSNNPIDIGLLNHNGELLWQVEHTPAGTNDTVIDITSVKDGIVVLSSGYRESDGNKVLFIQKYDYDGNRLWGEQHKLLMTGEKVLPYRGPTYIKLHDDGNGGVGFAWRQISDYDADVYFQHVNAVGEALIDGTGIRISSGFSSQYRNVNTPTLVVTNNEFIVSWAARGGLGPFYDFAMFFQRVSRDGQLLLGSEPLKVAEINDPDFEVDEGYFDGGYLSMYGEQLSLLYSHALDYTSNDVDIRRVDFNLDGDIIRDQVFIDGNAVIGRVTPAASPFGELVTSFTTGWDYLSPTYLQSMQVNGEFGAAADITLEWPKTPWFVNENETFSTQLSFIDEASSEHNVNISTDIENVDIDIEQTENGTLTVSVDGGDDFSGVVPFTVIVTDVNDSSRQASMNYALTVTSVNNMPTFNLAESIDVGEQQQVDLDADIADTDSENLTVIWSQLSGESVDFDAYANTLSFTSPVVTTAQALSFNLTVSDGENSVAKDFVVNVANDKVASIAEQNITLPEATSTQINPQISGAKAPVAVTWSQVSGPELTLSTHDELSLSITAPFVDDDTEAVLRLSIVDANGETATQQFVVTVEDESSSGNGGSTSSWLLSLLTLAMVSRSKRTGIEKLEKIDVK